MRKLATFVASIIILSSPLVASAQTVDNAQLISLLRTLVAALEQQLADLLAQRAASTTPAVITPNTPATIDTGVSSSSIATATTRPTNPVFGTTAPIAIAPSCTLMGTTTDDGEYSYVTLSWELQGATEATIFPRVKSVGGVWQPSRAIWPVNSATGTKDHLAPQVNGFEMNVNGVNTCSWQ